MNRYVRRVIALTTAAALCAAALTGCGAGDPPQPADPGQPAGSAPAPPAGSGTPAPGAPAPGAPAPEQAPPGEKPPGEKELPQGGTKIFPDYRVVAYYGTAGNAALGVLGEGSPDQVLPRLRKAAKPFAGDREVQVAYELIATVAQAEPGPDGKYSRMIDEKQIQRYVDQARKNKVLVILDLQPGRGSFLPQAKRMEKFLAQPHVGLALDPEWRMPKGKVPGKTIGRVDPAEVNQVSAYVSGLVTKHRLPEKLFVLHQFRSSMLPDVQKIAKRPGLAMVQHVDGFGTRSEKDATYRRLRKPQQFHLGYKLFYDEDVKRYQAKDVLEFDPVPELISFQ